MKGSREVSDAYLKCITKMEAKNTQPHGNPPATSDSQPFGKKPPLKPALSGGA
jgi:hypothetical protein